MTMRLLSTDTEGNFTLRTFHDERRLPAYAILSHTWTEDQEVTYDELVAGTGREKAGYAKLRFCKERIVEDGLEYFWVDTCCIDKTSSAELTEAINSMYRWYSRATVCYVYLNDFDLDTATDPVPESIARCRWWTRGWCLQELLAPDNVRFYDCYGRFVGSKKTLRALISKITRISESVLEQPDSLYTLPIAQRMSWASARETTRVEDIAYCLLGIFDVQMPMLYGEGEKAFIRLQEEIIKKSNDLSIFAWTMDIPEFHQDMFAPTPSHFSECHDIAIKGIGGLVFSEDMFSMTNRGLRFASIGVSDWSADMTTRAYVMPLSCFSLKGSRPDWRFLFFKKIGPGLFVRTHGPGDLEGVPSPAEHIWRAAERDVYVVPKVTAALQDYIQTSYRHSIEFSLKSPKGSQYSLLEKEPQEVWDLTRRRFLILGNPAFMGYVKIDPGFTTNRGSNFFFIIVSCIETHSNALEPKIRLIDPDIWERWADEKKGLRFMLFTIMLEQLKFDNVHMRRTSELDLASCKVIVKLQKNSSRLLPSHTILVDCKQHEDPDGSM